MAPERTLPRTAMHAALGAVWSAHPQQPRVVSYGDPRAEYAASREGSALVDLHERGLLQATGAVRQKFLDGMLTHEVASLRAGEGRAAALLTARGGITALLRVVATANEVLLELDAERLALVQQRLEHFRVAAPVRFAPRPEAVLALLGPRAAQALDRAGGAIPPPPAESHVETAVAGQPVRVVRAGDLPLAGFVLHVEPDRTPAVWDALRTAGARPAGRAALDALRIEALRPWDGTDVDEDNLLHETGLLDERSSRTKGCYLGQEIVARLEGRGGNVSRALRGLKLTAAAARDAPLTSDGREVGRVTSAAESPRLGPIAMGYVHRSCFAPGTELLVGGSPATVVARFEERS